MKIVTVRNKTKELNSIRQVMNKALKIYDKAQPPAGPAGVNAKAFGAARELLQRLNTLTDLTIADSFKAGDEKGRKKELAELKHRFEADIKAAKLDATWSRKFDALVDKFPHSGDDKSRSDYLNALYEFHASLIGELNAEYQ